MTKHEADQRPYSVDHHCRSPCSINGVPLGIFISYFRKISNLTLGGANLVQAYTPNGTAGACHTFSWHRFNSCSGSCYSIFASAHHQNTYTGITGIDKDILEAAKAIGLTKFQILTKIRIPLALPVIMAGVRISSVTAVGPATMAALIGASGLGF